jgi:hypothetical protein
MTSSGIDPATFRLRPQPTTLPHAPNFCLFNIINICFSFNRSSPTCKYMENVITLLNFNLISNFTCFNLLIESVQIFECFFNVPRSAATLCLTQIPHRAVYGFSESDDLIADGPLEHGYRNPALVGCVYELDASEFPQRCPMFDTKSGLVVLLVKSVALRMIFSE